MAMGHGCPAFPLYLRLDRLRWRVILRAPVRPRVGARVHINASIARLVLSFTLAVDCFCYVAMNGYACGKNLDTPWVCHCKKCLRCGGSLQATPTFRFAETTCAELFSSCDVLADVVCDIPGKKHMSWSSFV